MITTVRLVNTFLFSHSYHFFVAVDDFAILNPQLFKNYKIIFGKINRKKLPLSVSDLNSRFYYNR